MVRIDDRAAVEFAHTRMVAEPWLASTGQRRTFG
jgi:hypothetical protein